MPLNGGPQPIMHVKNWWPLKSKWQIIVKIFSYGGPYSPSINFQNGGPLAYVSVNLEVLDMKKFEKHCCKVTTHSSGMPWLKTLFTGVP